MANWFSNVRDRLKSYLSGLQVRPLLSLVLVGVLLLTTGLNHEGEAYGRGNRQDITKKVLERVHENDSPRPKTTGEWQKEDRETANNVNERGRRITEQAGAAFKEFGSGYGEAMKDATQDAQESAARTGQNLMDRVN